MHLSRSTLLCHSASDSVLHHVYGHNLIYCIPLTQSVVSMTTFILFTENILIIYLVIEIARCPHNEPLRDLFIWCIPIPEGETTLINNIGGIINMDIGYCRGSTQECMGEIYFIMAQLLTLEHSRALI